jgi:amidase
MPARAIVIMGYQWEIDTGDDQGEPWRVKAAAKRADILKKIPPEWRLNNAVIENAKEQREVTNGFMDQFFAPDEISILSMDTVPIVEAIKSRKYTAEQVARSFCKAAAIAHQIVMVQS